MPPLSLRLSLHISIIDFIAFGHFACNTTTSTELLIFLLLFILTNYTKNIFIATFVEFFPTIAINICLITHTRALVAIIQGQRMHKNALIFARGYHKNTLCVE